MASVTAEYSLTTTLDSAETDADPRSLARGFGILLLAMCLTPSCALVTCAANPDLAGDMVIRSE